jgi:hypothetical protein
MDMHRLAELQQTFVAPRPLTQSRPRDVELTLAGRVLVGVAVGLFAGAVIAATLLAGEARRQAENRRALVENGRTVGGDVTRLWTSGDDRRRVEYRFVVDGRAYTGRTRVSESRRRTLSVGSPIDVRYVPANPRVHDLGGTPRGGMPVWLPIVVAAGIGLAGALCLHAIRRQRQLLTDGRIAPGIVTGHQKQKTSHGTHLSLTFEFPLLSGAVAKGKAGASSKSPAVGSVITVVYDPDRPSRNRLYPMPLVRPIQ